MSTSGLERAEYDADECGNNNYHKPKWMLLYFALLQKPHIKDKTALKIICLVD